MRLANALHTALADRLRTPILGPSESDRPLNGIVAGVSERLDPDFDRVREALDTENAWRAGLGLGPLGPPAETVPPWDGTDPAPARQVSAWSHRTDFGGHAAINVRYGRNCVLGVDERAFAARVKLTTAELRDIEDGHVTLSLDDTEQLLNSAALEQFAHLEPYDAHDDAVTVDLGFQLH